MKFFWWLEREVCLHYCVAWIIHQTVNRKNNVTLNQCTVHFDWNRQQLLLAFFWGRSSIFSGTRLANIRLFWVLLSKKELKVISFKGIIFVESYVTMKSSVSIFVHFIPNVIIFILTAFGQRKCSNETSTNHLTSIQPGLVFSIDFIDELHWTTTDEWYKSQSASRNNISMFHNFLMVNSIKIHTKFQCICS